MQAARESVATNLSNCKDKVWRDDQIVLPRPHFRPSGRISCYWGRESCVTDNFSSFHRSKFSCEICGQEFLTTSNLQTQQKKGEDQVKRIAGDQARSSGKEEDVAIKQLFQKLGVLVNGNAAILLNMIPHSSRNFQIIWCVIKLPSPLSLIILYVIFSSNAPSKRSDTEILSLVM